MIFSLKPKITEVVYVNAIIDRHEVAKRVVC